MYTDEVEVGSEWCKSAGFPRRPRCGSLFDKRSSVVSSKCPDGVRRRPPSGLKVSRRKKFVKLSSPYKRVCAINCGLGGARMAGKGGIGDGDRPMWVLYCEGDPGAFELKEERRDIVRSEGGGRKTDCDGVLAIDGAGVSGTAEIGTVEDPASSSLLSLCPICSLALVIADSASLAVDSALLMRGRLLPTLGVRLCRTVILVFFPTACTSTGAPGRADTLYTCTARSLLCVAIYSLRGSHATPCTK